MTTPTCRSLTEVFILMRNNAVQSKHMFADQSSPSRGRFSNVPLDDKESLLTPEENVHLSRMPPEWVSMVDEIHYEMSRIRTKLKELHVLQQKHVLRPNFDDDFNAEEEKVIKNSSDQMTSMLTHCQRLIHHIEKSACQSDAQDQSSASHRNDKLMENVVRALMSSLQQLTSEFRTNQSTYLKKLQAREDSYTQYFADSNSVESSTLLTEKRHHPQKDKNLYNDSQNMFGAGGELDSEYPVGDENITMAQLQMIDESTAVVEQREREILQITKSLVELNHLFKDVATLVVDQGTVVDRIDYNIEQSSMRVKSGLQQVKKAESYQKKNRKMLIIVILACLITFLLIILIVRNL